MARLATGTRCTNYETCGQLARYPQFPKDGYDGPYYCSRCEQGQGGYEIYHEGLRLNSDK